MDIYQTIKTFILLNLIWACIGCLLYIIVRIRDKESFFMYLFFILLLDIAFILKFT